MSVQLINHLNSPKWCDIHKKIGSAQLNGARTYSELISEYYFPIFKLISPDSNRSPKIQVITVTTESKPLYFSGDILFVFLHEIKDKKGAGTVYRQKAFAKLNNNKRVIFVVWNEDWKKELEAEGLEAIYLPMAIDVKALKKGISEVKDRKRYRRKLLWFGNLRGQKMQSWYLMKSACMRHGWTLDLISGGKFNREVPLTREQTMQKVAEYKYGVGVGRCAAEMAALGLKVFCFSYGTRGYLPVNKAQADFAVAHNMYCRGNEKISPEQALINFENAVVCEVNDIPKCQDILRKELKEKGFFDRLPRIPKIED